MWGNPQGNAGEINGISFFLFCFVCLFVCFTEVFQINSKQNLFYLMKQQIKEK